MLEFPLHLSAFPDAADSFPARNGRVSFEPRVSARLPASTARFFVGLHFEFSEFHRKVSGPAETSWSSAEEILAEYAFAVARKIEAHKNDCSETFFASLARAGLVFELAHICCFPSGPLESLRLPGWVVRHCGIDAEALIREAEDLVDRLSEWSENDERRFWRLIGLMGVLDMGAVISVVLARLMSILEEEDLGEFWDAKIVSKYSCQLVLAFCQELPALADIAAGGSVEALEKRRAMASVAFFRDVHASTDESHPVNFFWKIQVGDDPDWVQEQLVGLERETDFASLTWFEGVALAWAWVHPLDRPGAGLSALAREIGFAQKSQIETCPISVIDACVFGLFSGDLASVLALLVDESEECFGGVWFPALVADLLFFIDAHVGEVRDSLLGSYARWWAATMGGLGGRIACDIVGTLGNPQGAQQGLEWFLGKSLSQPTLSPTKQWLLSCKLAHDRLDHSSIPESLCLQRFCQNTNPLDAIHALVVAAEVGPDIHLGACRLSDYLDRELPGTIEAFQRAHEHSLGVMPQHAVLPEYIESGRFEFVCALVGPTSVDELIRTVSGPNCPPEMILKLVTEIRSLASAAPGCVGPSEAAALSLALLRVESKSDQVESLLLWVASELAYAALTHEE